MNYVEAVQEELGEILEDCEPELLGYYALLVLTTGENTTLYDVHNAWSVWQSEFHNPKHKSLIPFKYLSEHVKEMDRPYMEAIHKVASRGVQ